MTTTTTHLARWLHTNVSAIGECWTWHRGGCL